MWATFMTAKLDPMRLLPHIAISTPRNVFCIAAPHAPSRSRLPRANAAARIIIITRPPRTSELGLGTERGVAGSERRPGEPGEERVRRL
jgi:hypothetical protein